MWKRWRSLKDQDQEGTFAYKKEEESTNFEDFEEIQDDSSSNTVRILKSYITEEEESLKGKDRSQRLKKK